MLIAIVEIPRATPKPDKEAAVARARPADRVRGRSRGERDTDVVAAVGGAGGATWVPGTGST